MADERRKELLNLPLELVQRGFLYTLASLALGAALAFWPGTSVGVSYTLAAVGIIVLGIWRIWKYLVIDEYEEGREHQELASGLILLAGGIMLLVFRSELANMLPTIIGMVLLVLAAIRVQAAVDLKRMGDRFWYIPLAMAVLHLAGSLVVLIAAMEKNVCLTVLGALLLAEALCDLWCRLRMRHFEKRKAEAAAGTGGDEAGEKPAAEEKAPEETPAETPVE